MPTELDKSYEIMGRIFLFLLNRGLRTSDVYASELLSDAVEVAIDDELTAIFFHFRDVAKWMERERLIVTTGIDIDRAYAAQLTAKGVALAQKRFTVDGKETTITKQFKSDQPETDNYTNIGSLIGGLIGGAIKSIGS